MKEIKVDEIGLDFKDVYLVPQYTEINTRTSVDTTTKIFDDLSLEIPVISANMDTITEHDMANAMHTVGGLGALHRFMTIAQNVDKFLCSPNSTLVSVGVNGDSKERTQELYKVGARNFLVDIAHGHSLQMKEMLEWMRGKYSKINIMAGNVATRGAVKALAQWGAHSVKVGIGPGAVCKTKNITGVTVPQLTAIQRCADMKFKEDFKYDYMMPGMTKKDMLVKGYNVSIIADGGITEIGDIAKALAVGADAVMCGRMFASCKETPGPYLNGKKVYRGMASLDAMRKLRPEDTLPTPEGASIVIDEPATTAEEIMKHIKGGLQSSFSYTGARNLKEFQEKAKLRVRK
jgi:IMP dehydrogenase